MSYTTNLTNHKPSNYSAHASFVYSAKYTNAVLTLLDAKPGEKIIDLGCGTGELTRTIKEMVGEGGEVVGVDSSQAMVREAEYLTSTASFKYIPSQCHPPGLN